MLFSLETPFIYLVIIPPFNQSLPITYKEWLIYLSFPPKCDSIEVQQCLFCFHLPPLSTCYIWYLFKQLLNKHLFKNERKNKCGLSRTQIHWWCSVFPKTMKTIHDDVECFTDSPESPGPYNIYLPFQKGPEMFQQRTVGYHTKACLRTHSPFSDSLQQILGLSLHLSAPQFSVKTNTHFSLTSATQLTLIK